ncbi:hypothetical protein, partial [Paenibacillus xylanexedens]|uniref:hypothetical protein n=1 Tax=Paenibacillus xylanexedens TaxID=528191 RepID=UPI001C92D77F
LHPSTISTFPHHYTTPPTSISPSSNHHLQQIFLFQKPLFTSPIHYPLLPFSPPHPPPINNTMPASISTSF